MQILSCEERDSLVEKWVSNSLYKKVNMEPCSSSEHNGLWKAVSSKESMMIYGRLLTDDNETFLECANKYKMKCVNLTLCYQSIYKDRNHKVISEGDIIWYNLEYRVIEAVKNGNKIEFTFRRFRGEGNQNPMPLKDLKQDKIEIVSHIFDTPTCLFHKRVMKALAFDGIDVDDYLRTTVGGDSEYKFTTQSNPFMMQNIILRHDDKLYNTPWDLEWLFQTEWLMTQVQ